ncbi:hypothetical protein [Nocardia asteroides]|uniref:hypothetical protein n=1 Tax=Nocardia asteroides TaxID=1824 RepID=UPI001E3A49A2|nr:hypothetical protein [Nocardia asteroides]UGT62803.1 hypothetical protein LTT61_05555 [Nocardia asteroides]
MIEGAVSDRKTQAGTAGCPESVVDETVERLRAEFEDRLAAGAIDEIVRRCLSDLAGIPAGSLPELAERSARQRLLEVSAPPGR